MTKMMRTILERVLSEELGRQTVWQAKDKANGLDSGRQKVIDEIENFMLQNNIRRNKEFYIDGMAEEEQR